MEEVFERAERQFKDENKILDWLSSFERPERGATDYTRDAVAVRDQIIDSIAIREELGRIDDFDELRELRNQARTIGISNARDKLVSDIETKMSIVSKELAEISAKRVEERLETERLERAKAKAETRLESLIDNIPSSTLGGLSKIEDKLNQMEELEIDTSTARGLISERVVEIEEIKELRQFQKEQVLERKIALREQGIEPEF